MGKAGQKPPETPSHDLSTLAPGETSNDPWFKLLLLDLICNPFLFGGLLRPYFRRHFLEAATTFLFHSHSHSHFHFQETLPWLGGIATFLTPVEQMVGSRGEVNNVHHVDSTYNNIEYLLLFL